MELQKIHRVLWEAIHAKFSGGECTHAEPGALVFRPKPHARTITLHFEPGVWKQIAAEADDDKRLARIADNVARYVASASGRYVNNPESNAFKVDIDDHALDE